MITEIDQTKCTGCRICVEFCPMDVLRLDTAIEEIPPCQADCPARVDIRGYIYLLSQGDFDGAQQVGEPLLHGQFLLALVQFADLTVGKIHQDLIEVPYGFADRHV